MFLQIYEMDPFSITTGVLTLFTACHTAGKLLLRIRMLDAPELLQSLNNEITDLRLVLLDVKEHLEREEKHGSGISSFPEALAKLCVSSLEQAKAKVEETEAMLHYHILKPGKESELKVNRIIFLLYHDRLVRLRNDLRDARQKVAGLSSHLGIRNASRIECLLYSIHSTALPILMQRQTEIRTFSDQALHLPRPSSPLSTVDIGFASFGDAASIQEAALAVSLSRCTCSRWSNLIQLTTCLGGLFIGYMVAPMTDRCRGKRSQHNNSKLQLHYSFPRWLLRYALQYEANLDRATRTIKCSLTLMQIIPPEHVVFDLLSVKNHDAVKDLICSGQLSVNAQVEHWGASPLRVRPSNSLCKSPLTGVLTVCCTPWELRLLSTSDSNGR